VAAAWLWQALRPEAQTLVYLEFWPLLAIIPVGFTFLGLYPAAGVSIVQEFRRASLFVTAVVGIVIFVLFLTGHIAQASRGFFFLAWPFLFAGIPLARGAARHFLARRAWWGLPAMILGAGKTAEMVIEQLKANPGLDLKVMACLDDDPNKIGREVAGVPVVASIAEAPRLQRQLHATHGIIAMPGVEPVRLTAILQNYANVFPHLVLVPNVFGLSTVGIGTRDFGGIVGIYNKQNLLLPHNRVIKKLLDALLLVPLGLVALPIVAMSALAIYLVDRGNPLYTQRREGFGGRPVFILKLRTMRRDADKYLERYLESNPDARAEWESHFKLTHDPRILPIIGDFLRRTSLDELPQLWNIARGEMSLVGPRPFPYYHLERFGDEFRHLRTSVIPGLTGYWQVTSRSDADVLAQEQLDSYYIRNWSLWMDLYVLARTPWSVVFGKGAR